MTPVGGSGAGLRSAAAAGDVSTCVRLLAAKKHGRLGRDELGRSALHLAASAGHVEIVRVLLQAAAPRELDAADAAGCTALQRAAADGHESVVKLLLDHGAAVDKQDAVHGNSALHEAAWKGYSRTVSLLSAAGADLSLTNSGGFTALHLCCQNGHNQSCRELLLAGCDPDLQNNYGDSSLHTAARYGHAGVTRILISAQCRVSEQNKNGDTALHIAAAMGRRKLTRILLEAGCDRTLRNKQQETAADIAIRKDLDEILVILQSTKPKRKDDKVKEKHKRTRKTEDGKQWSPYGCHYYPDSSSFPKPKLDSLPNEPLRKGEQYYLDLAGNIRKGPVGVGYTCYCAPLFRHMEERLERDKRELKEHIDQAHARLGHRVAGLEHRTRGHLQQMSRTAAAERARCERRHRHLEQWLARGAAGRHSERNQLSVERRPQQHRSTLVRSRSLEFLDEPENHARDSPDETVVACKSLDELDATVFDDVSQEEEPRRTVAEIVARLQGGAMSLRGGASPSSPPPLPPVQETAREHSESSDDEDRPLRLAQQRGPLRDGNLVAPDYENVGTYPSGTANGPRSRSAVYSPEHDEVARIAAGLRLCDEIVDRETNNDSGYSTKVYGSSKGNSPSLSGGTGQIGASSLV